MNSLFVIAGLIAVCASKSPPTVPGDNSHYVEGESRYIWMPDSEGKPVLVDLEEPVDEALVKSRNGANNLYLLFTRLNQDTPRVIVNGDFNSVWRSGYDGNRPLKVIVHGWNNNANTAFNSLITAAFLAVQDANVIVVDWSALAGSSYSNAANGVLDVGQHLGRFLTWLINTAGGNWNQVHLVGFSLGAHIVGNAGRTVGGRIARITGLDPAGPGWNGNAYALNHHDGQYVEGIHTDGRILGIFNPVGDADFYPNGGLNPQPGCLLSTCSHGRATELFAASVYTNHLVGRQCPNLGEAELTSCRGEYFHMGNSIISKYGRGLYGLRTGRSWPF